MYLAFNQVRHKSDTGLLVSMLLAFVLFYMLPFDNNLIMGQVNIIVLTFIAAALVRTLVHSHDLVAGMLLAPAALIKITPAFLLLFFLLDRRWRAIPGFALGLALLIFPTFLIEGGGQAWLDFFDFGSTISYGKTIPGLLPAAGLPNFSLAGCLARSIQNQTMVRVFTWVLLFALFALLVFQHVRLAGKRSRVLLLLPYLVFMTIASPLVYFHHVIYIYPGLLITVWMLVHDSSRGSVLPLALALGAGLMASIDFPTLYNAFHINAGILRSLNLYALLSLFCLGLALPEMKGMQWTGDET